MEVKTALTVFVSKLTVKILRLLNSGATTLPGKIALFLNKKILFTLSKNYNIIAITGTNGKTTTSRIIASILENNNLTYFTNKSGANLLSGITTTFIVNYKKKADYVLLEIDEAAFSIVTNHIKPKALVVTNFYRDQLDRYGELYSTLNKVKSGLKKSPNTCMVINADDSLSSSLGKDLENKAIYYGFSPDVCISNDNDNIKDAIYCKYCKSKYRYLNNILGHLGNFVCDNCGYKSPNKHILLSSIKELSDDYTTANVTIKAKLYDIKIALPALYNVYNALSSLGLAYCLNLDINKSINALSKFECGFGRMEKIRIEKSFLKLLLVKNPVGFNSSLQYVNRNHPRIICFAINDNIADGKDISWLWDVNFEMLLDEKNINTTVICSGRRAYDMALRLKYMNFPKENILIEQNYQEMIKIGLSKTKDDDTFYIMPTYTAMLDIRSSLDKYNIKEIWE